MLMMILRITGYNRFTMTSSSKILQKHYRCPQMPRKEKKQNLHSHFLLLCKKE